MEIVIRNTNDSAKFYRTMVEKGQPRPSRNGPVLRLPGVTTLEYRVPRERVNFCPVRDANPFFHLMEGLAILGGMNSVDWLCTFNEGMRQYSDDGKTWNAFYGTRLMKDFGYDQIDRVIKVLRDDPQSRQAVCQIWDTEDLGKETKDKACNMAIVFQVDGFLLDMTVFNRSNDAIWGSVTGANTVHFSMIQEYVATRLGLSCGSYYQVSNNMHVYTDNPQWGLIRAKAMSSTDEDSKYKAEVCPHLLGLRNFDSSLARFLISTTKVLQNPGEFLTEEFEDYFIERVAKPMFNAFIARKLYKCMDSCLAHMSLVEAPDWALAGMNWIERREAKKNA